MIASYRDKRTSDFAVRKRVKEFSGFERSARLKLDRLQAAISVEDLAALPGNRFERLKGNRKGQYASESTINGGFALSGWTRRMAHRTWR